MSHPKQAFNIKLLPAKNRTKLQINYEIFNIFATFSSFLQHFTAVGELLADSNVSIFSDNVASEASFSHHLSIMQIFGFREKYPYKIGLALSGGGARGFAHAGAIKALLEFGIRPDIVAGVSAGSVVAAMYAAGMSPDEMLHTFKSSRFGDFAKWSIPRDGIFSIDSFRDFLGTVLKPYTRIEDLPVKTVIGVTDLDNGQKVALESGPLAQSIVASCSIPIVFKPAIIGNRRFIDGGVTANLPAWAIRKRCKFLIGINCSPLTNRRVKSNILNIALRSYELIAKSNVINDMNLCDLTIRTDGIAGYQAFNLKEIQRIFDAGYTDTLNLLLFNGLRLR